MFLHAGHTIVESRQCSAQLQLAGVVCWCSPRWSPDVAHLGGHKSTAGRTKNLVVLRGPSRSSMITAATLTRKLPHGGCGAWSCKCQPRRRRDSAARMPVPAPDSESPCSGWRFKLARGRHGGRGTGPCKGALARGPTGRLPQAPGPAEAPARATTHRATRTCHWHCSGGGPPGGGPTTLPARVARAPPPQRTWAVNTARPFRVRAHWIDTKERFSRGATEVQRHR